MRVQRRTFWLRGLAAAECTPACGNSTPVGVTPQSMYETSEAAVG